MRKPSKIGASCRRCVGSSLIAVQFGRARKPTIADYSRRPGSPRFSGCRLRPDGHSISTRRTRVGRAIAAGTGPNAKQPAAGEILMNEGDRDAALADGGGDALDRAEANVATGEHARHAGLDQIGVAAFLPATRFDHIAAGENIAARVARDFGRQPSGFGVGADEHEQPPRLFSTDFIGCAIDNVDRGQMAVAVDAVTSERSAVRMFDLLRI